MTSEVEERPRLVTAGYGRHGSQWVKDKLISPKQIVTLEKISTTRSHLPQYLIFQEKTSSKSCEDWTELIFSPQFSIPGWLDFSALLAKDSNLLSLHFSTIPLWVLYSCQVLLRVVLRLYFATFSLALARFASRRCSLLFGIISSPFLP